MTRNRWLKGSLRIAALLLVLVVLYAIWDAANGGGVWEVSAGIGLLLVLGAMLHLKQMENVSERKVMQRVRAEFSSESQLQVIEVYKHLKIRELEGLFLKILDDAQGDPAKVKKLASVAESVGWKAFLENHW